MDNTLELMTPVDARNYLARKLQELSAKISVAHNRVE
jgi:hypothetical protein